MGFKVSEFQGVGLMGLRVYRFRAFGGLVGLGFRPMEIWLLR